MHFYPGVAEYQEPGKDPYRVFLNEDTIRSMDPSFAGRPIFVEHVDSVNEDVGELRKEADGWVSESFFNAADGKHWVKFIVVTEKALRAIENGMRLSNAYLPTTFGAGGLWNGVSYAREVTGGEYEHLAIVGNPRYEESVILTPEQFKQYNEDKVVELKRLSNSKDPKGEKKMAFKLFKRTKVENSADMEGMCVVLPKSQKEMTLTQLVEEHDKIVNMHGYANGDHLVKVGENEMSVNDLVKKHMEMNDELEAMKGKKEDAVEEESEIDMKKKPVDSESEKAENEDDDSTDNEEEDGAAEKKLEAEKKKNDLADKKAAAKVKADALRNAHLKNTEEVVEIDSSDVQVARGKTRYGS